MPDKVMQYTDLLASLGFERDPFATTNADEEDLLEEYFIEPPFFKAVYGDIRNPKSTIVYAPRGGGKTALKRRIELISRSDAFLCVTYNQFPTAGMKLGDVDQQFHLRNITRILTVAILSATTTRGIDNLTSNNRHFLYLMTKAHLSGMDRAALKESVAAVQNLSDKAKETWNALTGPVGVAINAVLSHFGFKAIEMSKFEAVKGEIGDFTSQISFLASIAPSFGYLSTYILVDKIDENSLTGKASQSLAFIRPVLSDLALLETRGLAFKLFLWDLLEDDARVFTRPDRIKNYKLSWSPFQLMQMLSKRLAAHSNDRVKSLKSITSTGRSVEIDDLIVTLSGGSPRNIIRICKAIFDQQSEIDASAKQISERALLKGIETIAEELASEALPPGVLKDLKKLKRADFTVRNIYADVFRISQPSGLQKVQSWQDSGAVVKIGNRQETRGNRPSNLYAVASPIVLKNIFSDMDALDFWEKKVKRCSCGELLLRDWDISKSHSCHACERSFSEDGSQA
jgi:hypothetical protein